MPVGSSSGHWDKLIELIEKAKEDTDGLGALLRHGSPLEVTQALQSEVGMTMDDLGALFEDLEHIADRDSIRFWSPLA